jgi:hypothetical protein
VSGDVEVVEEAPSPAAPPSRGPAAALTGAARKGLGTFRGLTDRMAGGDRRRGRLVALAIVLLIVAIIIVAALMGGGGFGGGGGDGPQFVGGWGMDGLEERQLADTVEGAANLEGQTSTYVARLQPGQREVMFVTSVYCRVTWTDETTPPVQTPAPGYTNTPDSFQLFIVPQGFGQAIQSELVYNTQGRPGTIELEHTFEKPIPVANPDGADYLPKGSNATWRVDFKVYTGDCGEWESSRGILPPIGDGGNYFDFEWSVSYMIDTDGRP